MAARPTPGVLGWVERAGNRLPHPATLFCVAALTVMVLSQIAEALGWRVPSPGGEAGSAVSARGLLDADGLWWALSHLVENFVTFPPLGVVLVAMLGIGVAERSGFLGALLSRLLGALSQRWLTPATVFVGILSSIALDAGYVVLPPLAASLYLAAGRNPLAGIAAVFAGVSAGFSANLFLTGLDPMLAGFTQSGARLIDADYRVAVTANWWFMIASTLVLTAVGWAVTAGLVERRLDAPARDPGPGRPRPGGRTDEARGLRAGLAALALALGAAAALVLVPGAPLHGAGERFPRWVEAMVPLLFLVFAVPGLAFGRAAGTVRSDKDAARLMGETMADLGPYVVLAFFAAQFIEFFRYSHLGEMLAIVGGGLLAQAGWPPLALIVALVLVVSLSNLFIGSASAKYAFFAPVLVPMLMQTGISPELTQAAYRVGDSVSNIVTPLNPYMIIILALVQRYTPGSGLGTLVALMLPYALTFLAAWLVLLALWLGLGVPLGPGGPLAYGAGSP